MNKVLLTGITGFIGSPVSNRSNRSMEIFFVNGRYIKSRAISGAVEKGYEGFAMQHQFPIALLMLSVDGNIVDVNVHPTKQEVRFTDEQSLYELIRKGVHERLVYREDIKDVSLDEKAPEEDSVEVTYAQPFERKQIEDIKNKVTLAIHREGRQEGHIRQTLDVIRTRSRAYVERSN